MSKNEKEGEKKVDRISTSGMPGFDPEAFDEEEEKEEKKEGKKTKENS